MESIRTLAFVTSIRYPVYAENICILTLSTENAQEYYAWQEVSDVTYLFGFLARYVEVVLSYHPLDIATHNIEAITNSNRTFSGILSADVDRREEMMAFIETMDDESLKEIALNVVEFVSETKETFQKFFAKRVYDVLDNMKQVEDKKTVIESYFVALLFIVSGSIYNYFSACNAELPSYIKLATSSLFISYADFLEASKRVELDERQTELISFCILSCVGGLYLFSKEAALFKWAYDKAVCQTLS